MIDLNPIIGIGAFFLFSFLFFTKEPKDYLLAFLFFYITNRFMVKICHYITPLTGINFLLSGMNFLLIILFISILLRNNNIERVLRSKLGPYILIYISIFFVLSLLGPGSLIVNWKALTDAPLYMSFYFVGLSYFQSENRIKKFFVFFTVFYAINALYASYQSVFGFLEYDTNYLLTKTSSDIVRDTSIDPITGQEYYMVMGFSGFNYSLFYILSMLTIVYIAARKYFIRLVGKKIVFFLFSYFLLLVVTLERTPIIMLGFLPIALIKNKKKFVLYVVLLVAFIVLLDHYKFELYAYGSEKLKRFAEIANPFAEQTTLYGRLTTRPKYQIPLILNNPFGIGVNNQEAYGAHNNYIKIFLQIGWLGGVLFLFILYKSLKLYYHIYRKLKNTKYSQLPLGLLAAALAMIATGIPNIPFSYDCAIFFWLFLGLVENLPTIYNRQKLELNEKGSYNNL